MSVRAYPIKKIEHGPEIFNLWHDDYFRDLLDREGLLEQLNIDGYGILGICENHLKAIEEQIEIDIKEGTRDINWEEIKRAKEIIKNIKKEMKKQKTDCIDFYCF
ncbi:hypothetical protein J7L09_01635 [bacterium]|nr:hypothetical protein [bacterium]